MSKDCGALDRKSEGKAGNEIQIKTEEIVKMQIRQITSVANQGDEHCNHAYMTNGIGKLNIRPLVASVLRNKWRKNHELHTVERICFKCLRLEVVATEVDYSTPFTFAAAIGQLNSQKAS